MEEGTVLQAVDPSISDFTVLKAVPGATNFHSGHRARCGKPTSTAHRGSDARAHALSSSLAGHLPAHP